MHTRNENDQGEWEEWPRTTKEGQDNPCLFLILLLLLLAVVVGQTVEDRASSNCTFPSAIESFSFSAAA